MKYRRPRGDRSRDCPAPAEVPDAQPRAIRLALIDEFQSDPPRRVYYTHYEPGFVL